MTKDEAVAKGRTVATFRGEFPDGIYVPDGRGDYGSDRVFQDFFVIVIGWDCPGEPFVDRRQDSFPPDADFRPTPPYGY